MALLDFGSAETRQKYYSKKEEKVKNFFRNF